MTAFPRNSTILAEAVYVYGLFYSQCERIPFGDEPRRIAAPADSLAARDARDA